MTAPSGGLGGLIGASGAPNFPTIAGSVVNPKQSIWNIPTELNGYQIWYDNGYAPEPYDPTTESRNRAADNPLQSQRVMRDPETIMKQIAADVFNHPDQFLAIQHMLSSGAWGHVAMTGNFDYQTQSALKAAMVQYAQATNGLNGSDGAGVAISFKDYLLRTAQTAQAIAAQQAAGNAPQVHLADPTQIRDAAQNAAQQALGHGLTEAQLQQFVDKFQYEQMTAQTDAYTQSLKLPGEAMQYAQHVAPGDYQANQRQSFENTLVNMFAPSASNRPNIQPTPSV